MRLWQSGQMHGTVNPATLVYGGSNPSGRTKNRKGKTQGVLPFLLANPLLSIKLIPF